MKRSFLGPQPLECPFVRPESVPPSLSLLSACARFRLSCKATLQPALACVLCETIEAFGEESVLVLHPARNILVGKQGGEVVFSNLAPRRRDRLGKPEEKSHAGCDGRNDRGCGRCAQLNLRSLSEA
jgi:hypothetical protein